MKNQILHIYVTKGNNVKRNTIKIEKQEDDKQIFSE